ncbi:MAG TPA: hypothetical protein VKA92_09895, partial [Segetibacter sp.]|nr:hypothetical protein [Segetibacter sp.]
PKQVVLEGFAKENLEVITDKEDLLNWLDNNQYKNASVVFMSSGNYEGLDINSFAKKITST